MRAAHLRANPPISRKKQHTWFLEKGAGSLLPKIEQELMNIGNRERIGIWCHIMVLLFLVSIIPAFLIEI